MAECIKCGAFTTYINGTCTDCFKKDKKPFIQKDFVPSEGEEYIGDFLKLCGIKYKDQVRIEKLKGDYSDYRIADFYLPKYKTYIEFLGQWNNPEDKKRYIKKMEIYKSNNIPCVYLYPENLGFLPFAFDKRLQQTLAKSELHSELNKYKFYKLFKGESTRLVFIAFFIFLLFMIDYKKDPDSNTPIVIGVVGIIGYQIFKITLAYMNAFKLNKYPLSKVYE